MSQTATAEHDWPTARFRHLADVRKGILPLFRIEAHPELEVLPYLTMEYLRGDGSDPNLVPVDPSLLVAPADSILLLWDGANAGEFLRAKRGVVSSTSALVVPRDVDRDFLYWACKSQEDRIRAATIGMGIPHVNGDSLANVAICLPPPSQQRAIADYLDRETARLDTLVTAKERMLALLAERRRALIATAISGGVDSAGWPEPPAPGAFFEEGSRYKVGTSRGGDRAAVAAEDGMSMAVAAIEVSRHKLKHLASINDDVLDENVDVDFEMQYIDIGNVDSSGRISELMSYRFKDAPSRARRLVRDGDVIISTVRTYLQAITQIHEPPDNLVVSTGFAVVRPFQDRFDTRYCRYALREPAFLAEVEKRSVGANYPAINAIDLADIPIPIHPLPQQRAIADYLDRETVRLDALAVRIERTIALLKERRTALIAAAVTGRIDVESAA